MDKKERGQIFPARFQMGRRKLSRPQLFQNEKSMPRKSKQGKNKKGNVTQAEVSTLRFCAVPEQSFEKARVCFIPVPYDATTTYKSGSRDGALAILLASMQLDEPWGESEWHPAVQEQFFYTFEHLVTPHGSSAKEHMESLSEFIHKEVVAHGKIPFILGGEHTLSFASIKALYEGIKDFSILHFDAHPDLRASYAGEPFSHSAVMRRCLELGQKVSITSVGIRSVDRDTKKYIEDRTKKNSKQKSLNIFYAPDVPVKKIDETLKENVYITFDLDAFDHSVMPAVGTPQPGGLQWYPVIELLEHVIKNHNIIGADVVELSPIPGMIAPDFMAAKLVWKMTEMLYNKEH
jgi:agmatinase